MWEVNTSLMKVTEIYFIKNENMEKKYLNNPKKRNDEKGGRGVRKTEE